MLEPQTMRTCRRSVPASRKCQQHTRCIDNTLGNAVLLPFPRDKQIESQTTPEDRYQTGWVKSDHAVDQVESSWEAIQQLLWID
jgi:hypothetical protein